MSVRGYSAISVSNTVCWPGRMVKRNAAVALWLSSSACTTTHRCPCRPLEPERAEQRELLAGGIGGLDRQAARRQAVALALRHRAEIAGAEEGADLVEIVRAVDRIVQAEAGEADVAGRRLHLAEGEQVRAVADRYGAAVRPPRRCRRAPCRESRDGRTRAVNFSPWPRHSAWPGSKRIDAIGLVVQVLQRPGQRRIRCLVGLLRQVARDVPHRGAIKSQRLGVHAGTSDPSAAATGRNALLNRARDGASRLPCS